MKVAIVVPFATQRGGAELALEHLLRANRRGPQVEYHLTFLEEGHMADEAKVHAADVMDREGIKSLLGRVRDRFPRLSHLWVNAGYNGQDKGADWVVKALGWTAEIARHPPKVAPQDVMKAWAREWGKEGVTINWQKLCHLLRISEPSCRGGG